MSQKYFSFVTTAPRPVDYFTSTFQSLKEAGLSPMVFEDTEKTYGAWRAWKETVEFALTISEAPYILSFQDDVTVHPEILLFLDELLPKLPEDLGYLSLYTPTHYAFGTGYTRKPRGIIRMEVPAAYGACAIVFPRSTLIEMTGTKVWDSWLGVPASIDPIQEFENRRKNPHLIKHVDAAITQALLAIDRPMYYPIPSVAQHIGEISSLNHAHCPEKPVNREFERLLEKCLATGISPTSNGTLSRRYAQIIVDYDKPLIPQVFPNDFPYDKLV